MVPCAQGRVIVETARPAPPHFATCSTYRRPLIPGTANDIVGASISGSIPLNAAQTDQSISTVGKGAIGKNANAPAQSIAARPEELGVTPWYHEDYPGADASPGHTGPSGPTADRSLYPSYSYIDKELMVIRPDLTSTRNSSMESEIPRAGSSVTGGAAAPRKAYMDLRDAIALLDETCPNQEPSPSLTPRTPRTPLTPYPRNKRARSKSSDNSSNYSNERLSDRSFENARSQDKEKKRPFLKKIGISLTEDKPFLAKLAPRIIGKPYLEKIGPSKAVERPFLDKIGSSKTLDKFVFETPRYERRYNLKPDLEKPGVKDQPQNCARDPMIEEPEIFEKPTKFATFDRRRSGKGTLLKMYSFETEDLESTVQMKEQHRDIRDPLRGASLDDALDSGPSSLPLEITEDQSLRLELDESTSSGVELLKCRVTTSEEIIFSNAGVGSPREAASWGNSPRRKSRGFKKDSSRTSPRRRDLQDPGQSHESATNSPTKRSISNVSPDRQVSSQAVASSSSVYSPTKTRRQISEDKPPRQAPFERRGISSDNLLSKDRFLAAIEQTKDHMEKTRETSSEDHLVRRGADEMYSKETFKQLQDKFKLHEIPTETYADFKRRTRNSLLSAIGRHQQDRMMTNAVADSREDTCKDSAPRTVETTSKMLNSIGPSKSEDESRNEFPAATEIPRGQGATTRSVLRKQEGIDHPSDQEFDANSSLRRPKKRIFHEPSQETMDLLTELRKVKSLLKTPSWEKEDLELDKKPARMPKRVLLTDKEFCLSVERENSIRRPSKVANALERTEERTVAASEEEKPQEGEEKARKPRSPGPALFEKKCLSLDYADEEKPQKPEARALSLASTRNIPSEAEEIIDYSDLALICDSKSYSSEVFNPPSEEINEKDTRTEKNGRNHCVEENCVDIGIDEKVAGPEGIVQIQGRTSDLYEIISPRSTPFRVKKRLGKISVEESVKPESFTLGSKVDCRSVVTQKRTKCFPL